MKLIHKIMALGFATALSTACSDFLDTVPKDALSPQTAWQSEKDANNFLTGCYDGFASDYRFFYLDAATDIAYNNFPWEGGRPMGNGSMTPNAPGISFYSFTHIRRVNTLLENIGKCKFANEKDRKNIEAQARFIRAYKYFLLNQDYGGVPLIKNFASAEEARVPRNSAEEVRTFVENELDAIVNDIQEMPSQSGRIARAAVLALRMREALYNSEWEIAKNRAKQIIDMGKYSLEPDYANLFRLAGKDSKEIILAIQHNNTTYANWLPAIRYPNSMGGWSSIVPTQNLVNMYEMANGKTIDESDSDYDATHPFHNRDPRMAATIYYPGCDIPQKDNSTKIFNTLDKELGGKPNPDYPLTANNSSKTSLSWAKYQDPISQYSDIWKSDCSPILIRYAEVLLSYAEAANELNGPSAEVYSMLNQIRQRAKMPAVDETKYNTKETLRQLIQRERTIELAGEGMRRADILRWKDKEGKPLAATVINGPLYRILGTVNMDKNIAPSLRAKVTPFNPSNASEQTKADCLIENREWHEYNNLLPIPQSDIDANPQLKQNPGYQ